MEEWSKSNPNPTIKHGNFHVFVPDWLTTKIRSFLEIFSVWVTFHCSLTFVVLTVDCPGNGKWRPWSKTDGGWLGVCLGLGASLCPCDDWSCCTSYFSSHLWYISSAPSPGSTLPGGSSGSWCSGEAPSCGELCNIIVIIIHNINIHNMLATACSTLIGPDTLLWLVEPYYTGAKVYAITTHIKESKML